GLSVEGSLIMSGGTITATDGAVFYDESALTLTNGTMTADVEIGGTASWSGGAIVGDVELRGYLDASGTNLLLTGDMDVREFGQLTIGEGLLTVTGGLSVGVGTEVSGSLFIADGATLAVTGAAAIGFL